MPWFLVRVELHGAEGNRAAYDQLHTAMEEREFIRTVTYGSSTYWLPTAEYLTQAPSGSKDTVRHSVTAAVATTGFTHEAFICEIYHDEYCSYALKPVRSA